MRRVICGPKADGVTSILADGLPRRTAIGDNGVPLPLPDGNEQHLVWATDPTELNTTDRELEIYNLDLTPGAAIFLYVVIPPHSHSPLHRTPKTIDYTTLVSGSITLEAEDGSSKVLERGDTVVQLSGMHRWVNHTAEPCVMSVLALGIESDEPDMPWFIASTV